MLASGGTLEVNVVAYGDENLREAFEASRREVLRALVPLAEQQQAEHSELHRRLVVQAMAAGDVEAHTPCLEGRGSM